MQTQTNKRTQAARKTSATKRATPVPARGAVKTAATVTGDSDTKTEQVSAEELLKQDHRTVEQLFAKYETLEEAQEKQELARQICMELVTHTRLEEEIFYPACREKGVDDSMLDEAQVEHDAAKVLISELMNDAPDADYYDAKVVVLREQVKHHVREEEQPTTGIFAKASAADVDMNELGRKIQARKQELTSSGDRTDTPQPVSLHLVLGNPTEEEQEMASQYGRERDERTRSMDDDDRRSRYGRSRDDDMRRSRSRDDEDDDDRGGRSRGNDRERDEYGRFMSEDDRGSRSGRSRDDDEGRGGGRSRGGGGRERDEYGRSASDDDRGSRYSRSRDDDDDGRDRGQGGWFGDPRGHAEAAREGWRNREDRSQRSSRSRYDDDDDRGGGRSRGGGGREREEYGRSASDDDRGSRYGRSRDDDDDRRDRGQGGWFGDPRGHAEAAREGWRNREDRSQRSSRGRSDDDDDRGGGGRSRGGGGGGGGRERDEYGRFASDDDRGSRGSRSRDDDDDGRGHGRGGWFGDPRGHAEAAREGWRNR